MATSPRGVPFLFGKLPAHGDFVSRGLSEAAKRSWDDWATAALERLRASSDDFEAAHDAAPPWRFVAGPSGLGEGWRAGAVAPSIDVAGRRFVLALGVDNWSRAAALGCGLSVAARVEDTLYRAYAERLTADDVVHVVADQMLELVLEIEVSEALAADHAGPGVWWSPALASGVRIAAEPPIDLLGQGWRNLTENAA